MTAVKSPLPTLDGVSASRHWLPRGHWKTILEFLEDRFPRITTATWLARMARGEVVDELGAQLNPGSPYREGGCIFYYRQPAVEIAIPFDEVILYEDDNILVADKPHFLPVMPAGQFLRETLLTRLRIRLKSETLTPVHRLDRETAGVILFSKNPETRGAYTQLFRERLVTKVYEALAPTPTIPLRFPIVCRSRIVRCEPFFRMAEVEGEPNSETQIEQSGRISTDASVSLYTLRPITGKKHQLRIHMAGLGIPIINDRLYPTYERGLADDFSRPLKLLAKSLEFKDPLTGRASYFESRRSSTNFSLCSSPTSQLSESHGTQTEV